MASQSSAFLACAILVVAASIVPAKAGSNGKPIVPALFIFGDSTADSGNNNYLPTTVKSNHPPYGRLFPGKVATGRWSDGSITSDYLAHGLGLPSPLPYLHPDAKGKELLYGLNFASAGSGLLDITAEKFCLNLPGIVCNVSSLTNQLKWYHDYRASLRKLVGPVEAFQRVSQGFYLISTGINDYFQDYFVNEDLNKQYNMSSFQALLMAKHQQYIQELYTAGARRIGVAGLPAMGCLPALVQLYGGGKPGCVEKFNGIAIAYNQALQESLSTLSTELKGIKLSYIDAFTAVYEIVNSPRKYGFSVVERGCCGDGVVSVALLCNERTAGTCADANGYVFFDAGHTTQSMNKIVADKVFLQRLSQLL